jgi:hypothetical protein
MASNVLSASRPGAGSAVVTTGVRITGQIVGVGTVSASGPATQVVGDIYGRTFDVIYGRPRPMVYNAPSGARTYAVIMGRSFDTIYGRPFPGSL